MQETGPIYNVPLIDTLPLGSGGVLQQMPSRDDLQSCSKRFMRVAAAYEVLLNHYRKAVVDAERYRKLRDHHWTDGGLVVTDVDSVMLGSHCPYGERLDEAIDGMKEMT